MDAQVTIKLTTQELNVLRDAMEVYENHAQAVRKETADGATKQNLARAIIAAQNVRKVLG